MDLRRRFIFHGNAAAIGGRIVRPVDFIIDSPVSSSLTVAGGRSHAKAEGMRFGEWVSFASAETSAEGLFDNVKQQIELSYHRVPQEPVTTTTRVSAEVNGVSIDDKPRLTMKQVRASMVSTSAAGSGEPSIIIGGDTVIAGAEISGYGLVVELALDVFEKYDTRSKLMTAADNPAFVQASGNSLFMGVPVGRVPPPPEGRLIQANGTIYATIVKSITWAGDPFPGATIDQHTVVVPDFGTIYFGELLITASSRRLTMVRLELGSPTGGDVALAEVDSNGTWST